MVVVSGWLSGCGSPSVCGGALYGSCDYPGESRLCAEFAGFSEADRAQIVSGCADPNGASLWSTGPCTRVGAIGACRYLSRDGCLLQWRYMDSGDANTNQADCLGQGGTWINP